MLGSHHVAGEDWLSREAAGGRHEDLGRLLREKFGTISTVTSTRTTIVLETVKESTVLPLEVAQGDEKEVRRA